MAKSNQEIFFEHIKQIYLQNPHLTINDNTIYGELMRFNTKDDHIARIEEHSLVDTQINLFSKYKKNRKVNTYFTTGEKYFWVIENRGKKGQREYYNEVENSIKLYVAIDPSSIQKVSSMIFDFIASENILSQSKISRDLRNDAIVLRIRKKEDAEKVINYINSLDYKPTIKPNPFVFNVGNVSMAIDGSLSYNSTFCDLFARFLSEKKEKGKLEEATLDDFGKWISSEIEVLNNDSDRELKYYYDLDSNKKLKDFIMASEILQKNIDGSIMREDIYQKQAMRSGELPKEKDVSKEEEFNYMLHIMNGLVNKYGIEEAHQRAMLYMKGISDTRIFTRDKNIRKIVETNFTPERMSKLLKSMGYDALVSATNETMTKYDVDQARYAVSEFVEKRKIDGFTNDNDARSYLGFIISNELLSEAIIDKINEYGLDPYKETIINMILDDAEMISKRKGRN